MSKKTVKKNTKAVEIIEEVMVKKERKVKVDGLVNKKKFAVKCAEEGMTRPQTIIALQEKYPTMAANYAKTMCYSYLKEDGVEFAVAKKGKKPAVKDLYDSPVEETKVSTKNSSKKKSSKKSVKKSVKKEVASAEF